jgi:hypothetical protein
VKKYIQTTEGQKFIAQHFLDMDIPEFGFVVEVKTGVRTTLQNNSMHRYFGLLAKELNDAGLEIHMEYLGKSIEVPWTTESVKERIWKPVMLASTGHTSTTKLDRKDVSEIYEVIHRFMAQTHSLMVPFPDRHG